MKKLLGSILLLLGVIGGINVAIKLAHQPDSPLVASAYASGHTAGMITAPVVCLLLGIWLVTRE